jgi:hypothetical protein
MKNMSRRMKESELQKLCPQRSKLLGLLSLNVIGVHHDEGEWDTKTVETRLLHCGSESLIRSIAGSVSELSKQSNHGLETMHKGERRERKK